MAEWISAHPGQVWGICIVKTSKDLESRQLASELNAARTGAFARAKEESMRGAGGLDPANDDTAMSPFVETGRL